MELLKPIGIESLQNNFNFFITYLYVCGMTVIYSLEHPITHEIRYVGKTEIKLDVRLLAHCNEKSNTKKNTWIKSLKSQNFTPNIKILDIVDKDDWQFWEKYWISQCKAWGFNLTNMAEGGMGGCSYRQSPETIEKRKQSLNKSIKKGLVDYSERIKKLTKANKGRKVSEETKIKLRKKNLGKKASFESKIKKSKSVIQLSINGTILKKFYSICEASRSTNISKGAIQNVCCGRRKTAGNFKWLYNN